MMNKNNYTIIALGGSVISPAPNKINVRFLKKFQELILDYLEQGNKFVIVAGGGKTARLYQKAASKIVGVSDEDIDWLGIHSTRLNAYFLRTIFFKEAHPVILDNPQKPIKTNPCLIIASGWQPGCSTDFITIRLAQRFKAKSVIIASNISYVYEKDPAKHKGVRKFLKISWQDYRKLIKDQWKPGMSAPMDPIAAKLAQKLKLKVVLFKGTELKNFRDYLENRIVKGTTIY
jgi:uridylate kinase